MLIIRKYGGVSLATLSKIESVAENIAKAYRTLVIQTHLFIMLSNPNQILRTFIIQPHRDHLISFGITRICSLIRGRV